LTLSTFGGTSSGATGSAALIQELPTPLQADADTSAPGAGATSEVPLSIEPPAAQVPVAVVAAQAPTTPDLAADLSLARGLAGDDQGSSRGPGAAEAAASRVEPAVPAAGEPEATSSIESSLESDAATATQRLSEVAAALSSPPAGVPDTSGAEERPEERPEDGPQALPASSGFASFGLSEPLLEGLEAIGFREPSPIQKAAIPELLLGRDLVGQAQTGTGKTAAFGLPLLERIDPDQRSPQVLVLTPTRELALQVAEAISSYASRLRGVRVLAIYGGADFREQIQQLRRGVQIVVGTPGRVMDHMRQSTLDLSGLRSLVLDEADEMLRMGFIDDVEWVLEQLPEQRQVVLFSATMPAEIRRISQRYLRQPAEITIRPKAADSRRIRQRFLMVNAPQKLEALERVLEAERSEGTIIFARTKAITLSVAESLEQRGHEVAVLNGDVPQAQRERTIERLRDGRIDVLVATDVAARGLDVERVSLVINYDIPFDAEAYVHRIGRTGRAGRSGDAILFITPRERRFIGGLERATAQPIEPMEVPSNAAINQHRLDLLHQRLSTALITPSGSERERALLAEIVQRVAREQGADPEALALAALQLGLRGAPLLLEGPETFHTPRGVSREHGGDRPRQITTERGARRPGPEDGPPEAHMERFRIEVGWRDRIKPGNIVGAIANEAGLNGKAIGRIRIFDSHSTVDLPKGMPDDVFTSLQRLRVMNRELKISRLST
jgi:ATP-dependent RNA helicase DeaD